MRLSWQLVNVGTRFLRLSWCRVGLLHRMLTNGINESGPFEVPECPDDKSFDMLPVSICFWGGSVLSYCAALLANHVVPTGPSGLSAPAVAVTVLTGPTVLVGRRHVRHRGTVNTDAPSTPLIIRVGPPCWARSSGCGRGHCAVRQLLSLLLGHRQGRAGAHLLYHRLLPV